MFRMKEKKVCRKGIATYHNAQLQFLIFFWGGGRNITTIADRFKMILELDMAFGLPTDQVTNFVRFLAIVMDAIWYIPGTKRFIMIFMRMSKPRCSKLEGSMLNIQEHGPKVWSPTRPRWWKINFYVAIWNHLCMVACSCVVEMQMAFYTSLGQRDSPYTHIMGEAIAALFALREAC